MKNIFCVLSMMILVLPVFAQEQKPNESVEVNKKYDEQGNLIAYDSIYSYSYSSNNKIDSKITDSVFSSLHKHADFFSDDKFFGEDMFDDFFFNFSAEGDIFSEIRKKMKIYDSIHRQLLKQMMKENSSQIINKKGDKKYPSINPQNLK